jgi:hypothetical protein
MNLDSPPTNFLESPKSIILQSDSSALFENMMFSNLTEVKVLLRFVIENHFVRKTHHWNDIAELTVSMHDTMHMHVLNGA